jgi:protein-disulfide isomerase
MRKIVLFSLLIALFMNAAPCPAEIEARRGTRLTLEEAPIEVAASPDGSRIYVLTREGNILVLGSSGLVEGKIPVGKEITGLEVLPGGDQLLLYSGKEKAIEVLQVTVLQAIDIEGSPFKGPENAPVTIVAFDDYQCPYCARLEPVLKQVLGKYPREVKLVFKNFPLRMHQQARPAALAALAAHRQGKFWEYHDLLFANYSTLNEQKFRDFAKQIGLDPMRFEADRQGSPVQEQLNRDLRDGAQARVQGTPTVFINGRPVGNKTLEGFSSMIEAELEKSSRQ